MVLLVLPTPRSCILLGIERHPFGHRTPLFWGLTTLRGLVDLVSRDFEVLSSVEFGVNRPDSGPDHGHGAAEDREQDWA